MSRAVGRADGPWSRTRNPWPSHGLPATASTTARRARAADTATALRALPTRPPPPLPAPRDNLLTALHDLATTAHGQPTTTQIDALDAVAAHHRLDPAILATTAHTIGELILHSGQPAPTGPGLPELDALAGHDLSRALDAYAAHTRIAHATRHSDPDLPRLLLLTTALHHGIPANTLLTIPATPGPPHPPTPAAAAGGALRDDLVDWHGAARALDTLDATLHAATAGRAWLTRAKPRGVDDTLLALGVLHLTHPTLASHSLASTDLETIRALLDHTRPATTPTDLTRGALRAICTRAGWLLGTSHEQTALHRLEQRMARLPADAVRARLAHGQLTHLADRQPAHPGVARPSDQAGLQARQTAQLLAEASHEALARFAGHTVTPHRTLATALLARYPDRLTHAALRLTPGQLRTAPEHPHPDATVHPATEFQIQKPAGQHGTLTLASGADTRLDGNPANTPLAHRAPPDALDLGLGL
ncbi:MULTISPECIES: hypothetical protein [unclassified Pseudofrankia]|uniref:hypothetical protein n=1 Tax=unclassified Pseudofrankia TaxID=2994372 RepID=UPI0008D9BEC8|nr:MULTISPECIES: hypothetical protein [unclassified Pseudofrankia]MDT3444454.1 hypothetical protein [Pseudofrankia sp. BMG5.37]OHV57981.1 hypothetical protein BCD48_42660 [Pseudofrankia sp. BMG5.36]